MRHGGRAPSHQLDDQPCGVDRHGQQELFVDHRQPNAPYINGLAAQCGLATNFHTGESTALPSLPHYLAMTSGSTQGVTDNMPPSAHPLNVPSIFSQLGTGGWRALEESMPSNCYRYSSGSYAARHNPAAYYSNIRSQCTAQDVPLGAAPDISAPFTFLTPNLTHDMSKTATNTSVASQVKAGDDWLATEMPLILNTPEYLSGSTAVFLTWERATSATDQVPTLVVSPYTVPGTRSATAFTHYSLLKTTEETLGSVCSVCSGGRVRRVPHPWRPTSTSRRHHLRPLPRLLQRTPAAPRRLCHRSPGTMSSGS